jgi:hypothetical protein
MGGVRWLASGRTAPAAFAVVAVAAWVLAPAQAQATVRGPCTAVLAGRDVTTGHDQPSSAIHVDYRSPVVYAGRAPGRRIDFVDVKIEVLGLRVRVLHEPANGPTWSGTASIRKYDWAGIGLLRVRGTSFSSGRPLCTGTAYLCVEGKNVFLTAAGAASGGLLLVALLLFALGLVHRGRSSRGSVARRWGAGGLLGGAGSAVLLQQSCTSALTPVLAGILAGGGLLGMTLLGLLLGGMRPPPPPPKPEGEEEKKQPIVYQFVPSPGACRACKSHSVHRVYASAEAIGTDRPHTGCKCTVSSRPVDNPSYAAYFAGRTVYDDRMA